MSENSACRDNGSIENTPQHDAESYYAGLVDGFFREMRAPKQDFDANGRYIGRHLQKVMSLFPLYTEIASVDIEGLHGIEIDRLSDTEKEGLSRFFYTALEKGLKFYGRANKYFDGFTRIPIYASCLIGKRGDNLIIVEKSDDTLLFKVGMLYALSLHGAGAAGFAKKLKMWTKADKNYDGELLFRYSYMLMHSIGIVR